MHISYSQQLRDEPVSVDRLHATLEILVLDKPHRTQAASQNGEFESPLTK